MNLTLPIIVAFDVDHTLEVSNGPVSIGLLRLLAGTRWFVVGICGNWAKLVQEDPFWKYYCSFLGQMGMRKADFLRGVSNYMPHERKIFVGNDGSNNTSEDSAAAIEAGWEFVKEEDAEEFLRQLLSECQIAGFVSSNKWRAW